MHKEKIGILSLGCPRNLVDSENILGRLVDKGHRVVDITAADTALVNTCAFIEEAKRESIDAILDLIELKKQGKLKKIIVYGCLAQRYGDKLKKELPEVDAFVGRLSLNHSTSRFAIAPGHFVYLKICEGCVSNCSFCVIPKIKGKFSSLDLKGVLARARELDAQKPSEINIIGQDTSAWGMDLKGKLRLPQLLRAVAGAVKNARWIRLLYLNPKRVSDELLKVIRDEAKFCKYIDLPIQHINSRILKLMRRGTTKDDVMRCIDRIRSIVPGAAIRTAVISGFPTESEAEFKELVDFLEEVKFERLGAFIYSREEGTAAYNMRGQISAAEKTRRFDRLMSVQQKVSSAVNRAYLGSSMEVLIDEVEDGAYIGRSQFDAPEVDGTVNVRSKKLLKAGDFVKVKITDTLEYDLIGEAE